MTGTPVIHHSIGSPDSAPGTPTYEEEFFPDFVPPAPPAELSPIQRLVARRPSPNAPLFTPEDLNSSLFENSEDELVTCAPEVKEVRLAGGASRPATPRSLPQTATVAVAATASAAVASASTSTWAVAASEEGRLYFYARGDQTSSQWTCPTELRGYFPNSFDSNGTLPASIFHAAFVGAFAYLHAYWRVGGSFRRTDHLGRSALHFAAAGGHTDLVVWLLDVDLDILDYQDREGSSALSLACRYAHGLIAKHLVDANAAIASRDVIEAETFAGPELAAYLIARTGRPAPVAPPAAAVAVPVIATATSAPAAAPPAQTFFEAVRPVFTALKNRFLGSPSAN